MMLHDGAVACPGRFFDKQSIAKLVFERGRLPHEDSEDVKRLSSLKSGAAVILAREFRREILSDRLEGLRATVDDEDLLKTTNRLRRRRAVGTIATLHASTALIDPNKLSASGKDEFRSIAGTVRKLHALSGELPQLLNGKTDDKKNGHGGNGKTG
jgi:hypothetical protein